MYRVRAALLLLLACASASAETRRDRLVRGCAALGDSSGEDVERAVDAALIAETDHFSAELLLSISWGESRFVASTITGRACGVMQVVASTRVVCRELASDARLGMIAGVLEMEDERVEDRRTRGDVRLVLLAKACGNSAFDGTCRKTAWPEWVIRRAEQLGYRRRSPRS